MPRFLIFLGVVIAVSHVPFTVGLARFLARAGVAEAGLVATSITALLLTLLPSRLRAALADRRAPAWRVVILEEPYYAYISATLLSLPLAVVASAGVVMHAALLHADEPLERLGAALQYAWAASFMISIYGVMVRRRWVRVRAVEVVLPNLPASFEGYRIAHLSDLHIGRFCSRGDAQRWIDRVAALDVDLAVLTGDYITRGDGFHDDAAEVVAALRGRDGVVAVLGNHDSLGDARALVSLFRARGVTVLCNARRVIERGGESIIIAGVDDESSGRADVERAMSSRDGVRPLIALTHHPGLFPALARRGAALVLSGHTHWGQVALPFFAEQVNLTRLSSRYHAGVYRDGCAALMVSPGLGTTGLPVRLGVPPEITVLRLARGAPSSHGVQDAADKALDARIRVVCSRSLGEKLSRVRAADHRLGNLASEETYFFFSSDVDKQCFS